MHRQWICFFVFALALISGRAARANDDFFARYPFYRQQKVDANFSVSLPLHIPQARGLFLAGVADLAKLNEAVRAEGGIGQTIGLNAHSAPYRVRRWAVG